MGSIMLKEDVFKMSIKDIVLMSASRKKDVDDRKKSLRIGKAKMTGQDEAGRGAVRMLKRKFLLFLL